MGKETTAERTMYALQDLNMLLKFSIVDNKELDNMLVNIDIPYARKAKRILKYLGIIGNVALSTNKFTLTTNLSIEQQAQEYLKVCRKEAMDYLTLKLEKEIPITSTTSEDNSKFLEFEGYLVELVEYRFMGLILFTKMIYKPIEK
jgi:hypothetical protein